MQGPEHFVPYQWSGGGAAFSKSTREEQILGLLRTFLRHRNEQRHGSSRPGLPGPCTPTNSAAQGLGPSVPLPQLRGKYLASIRGVQPGSFVDLVCRVRSDYSCRPTLCHVYATFTCFVSAHTRLKLACRRRVQAFV